jgi:hypothetical protein
MKSQDSRIRELEMKVESLLFEIARLKKEARPAKAMYPNDGWFLGITRAAFSQGSTSVKVDVYIWTESAWKKKPVGTDGYITAIDWYLNEGETVEKDTKVKVERYKNCWVITGVYCDATDTIDRTTVPQDSMNPPPDPPGPGDPQLVFDDELIP